MKSRTEFSAWLKRNEPKCVLCEMKHVYQSGGVPTAGTKYISTHKFVSAATDSPASEPYQDVLKLNGLPTFSRNLDRQRLGGRANQSFGTMIIGTTDGRRDDLLELACDGSAISYYLGSPTWTRDDFWPVFSAMTERLAAPSTRAINVSLKDAGIFLDKTIAGDTLVGGTGVNKDRPRPIRLGYCHSVECILRDAATQTYVYADRSSSDPDFPTLVLAVRVRGADVAFTDNVDMTFTLTRMPDSPIVVAEVLGTPGGLNDYRVSDMLEELLGNRAGLTAAGAWDGPHGSFAIGDPEDFRVARSIVDRENLAQTVIEDICTSALIFVSTTSDNKVTYGRIRPHAVGYVPMASQCSIPQSDLLSISIDHGAPRFSTVNGYGNRRYVVLTDIASGPDLGPTASLGIEGYYYEQPLPTGNTYDAAPHKYHKTMTPSPPFKTLLVGPSDTTGSLPVAGTLAAWADVHRGMFLPWLEFVDVVVPFWCGGGPTTKNAFELEIGDVVTLTHTRYGWSAGALFQVIGIEIRLSTFQVGLTLVRRRRSNESTDPGGFLLQENGFYVLQEDGSRIRIN